MLVYSITVLFSECCIFFPWDELQGGNYHLQLCNSLHIHNAVSGCKFLTHPTFATRENYFLYLMSQLHFIQRHETVQT